MITREKLITAIANTPVDPLGLRRLDAAEAERIADGVIRALLPVLNEGLPAVRESMRVFMADWSESNYCAGWLNGLEHTMASRDEPTFRLLVECCGGWWTFDEFIEGTWDELKAQAAA